MFLPRIYMRYLKEHKKRSASTLQAYFSDLDQFCRLLVPPGTRNSICDLDAQLLKVNSEEIDAFKRLLQEGGLAASTVHRKLTVLSGFYAWLVKTGRLKANPCVADCCPGAISLPEGPNPEVVLKLLESIDSRTLLGKRDRAILSVLYNTGIRISELLCLKQDDIDWQEGILYVRGGGRLARQCKLWGWVVDALRLYVEAQPGGSVSGSMPLFVNRDKAPLSSRSVRRKFAAYSRQAGLGIITPSMLRHACAMLMLRNGVEPSAVKRQLGHLANSSIRPYLESLRQTVPVQEGRV